MDSIKRENLRKYSYTVQLYTNNEKNEMNYTIDKSLSDLSQ